MFAVFLCTYKENPRHKAHSIYKQTDPEEGDMAVHVAKSWP